ncbi:hypothetical protein [Heyndrickxia camelliae]|uniref:Uncharacterized protein n=1 Tax=Heyndrickxia camelliae TaxID=1707093 RepID=A0A2N3LFV6_9BACI|nr:hypothetical protein [Heyndrickxia camelliae]PKR83532.1 hypothetical protein CWO92_18375 [Heyndrickxia camelliae]
MQLHEERNYYLSLSKSEYDKLMLFSNLGEYCFKGDSTTKIEDFLFNYEYATGRELDDFVQCFNILSNLSRCNKFDIGENVVIKLNSNEKFDVEYISGCFSQDNQYNLEDLKEILNAYDKTTYLTDKAPDYSVAFIHDIYYEPSLEFVETESQYERVLNHFLELLNAATVFKDIYKLFDDKHELKNQTVEDLPF